MLPRKLAQPKRVVVFCLGFDDLAKRSPGVKEPALGRLMVGRSTILVQEIGKCTSVGYIGTLASGQGRVATDVIPKNLHF